jgi:hypothetical protein
MSQEPAFTAMREFHRKAYQVVNVSTAPVWLAMIIAPRSRLTAWLVARSVWLLGGLGAAYSGFLAAGALRGNGIPDFRNPDSLRRALGSPEAFLAGWIHYLAFDLFVGRWIWREATGAGRRVPVELALTWMLGPVGLVTYLLRRSRFAPYRECCA